MIGDGLRDEIKQARTAVEDCFSALSAEAYPEDTRAEIYRFLDEADVALQVAGGLVPRESTP